MSNKIILEVNENNDNDNEVYPPFFPQHFFVKEQPKKSIINQSQIRPNPNNYFNSRVKSNLSNNNMFFMRKF